MPAATKWLIVVLMQQSFGKSNKNAVVTPRSVAGRVSTP